MLAALQEDCVAYAASSPQDRSVLARPYSQAKTVGRITALLLREGREMSTGVGKTTAALWSRDRCR